MLDAYPKVIITKDGTAVLLRPMIPEDEEQLRAFFSRIPERERWFRREDVSDPSVVHQWVEKMDYQRVLPMVAVTEADGTIIANMSMHRRTFGCLSHVGHIRIMVDPAYRAQRLGTWMLLDMVKLAMGFGVEKLVAELVAGVEDSALRAVQKLDFFKEAVLENYVKDQEGKARDLIIMVKTLHREWSDF
jgi:L-amino acid N-acyltransferase YncA